MSMTIGKIGKAVGLKGKVKLTMLSAVSVLASEDVKLFLKKNVDAMPVNIESFEQHDTYAIVKFVEFNSITDAERWKNADLMTNSDIRQALEADEYLYADLIGCKLLYQGKEVGEITSIMESKAYEIFHVNDEKGNEILIPFLDNYIKKVDIERKVIYATDNVNEFLDFYR